MQNGWKMPERVAPAGLGHPSTSPPAATSTGFPSRTVTGNAPIVIGQRELAASHPEWRDSPPCRPSCCARAEDRRAQPGRDQPVLEPAAQTFADATDTPPYLFHMAIEDGRRTVGSVQVSDIPAYVTDLTISGLPGEVSIRI